MQFGKYFGCIPPRKQWGCSFAEMDRFVQTSLYRKAPSTQGEIYQDQLDLEWKHHKADRPYYNVWPAAGELFAKVKLDLPYCAITAPIPFLELRFPVGGIIQALLCGFAEQPNSTQRALAVSIYPTNSDQCLLFVRNLIDKCVETDLETIGPLPNIPDSTEMVRLALRTIVGLCLIHDDPTLVEPKVLSADETKVQADPSRLEGLVKKAKQRGEFGFHLGRQLEQLPHFRRPHFSVRWTGKGRTEPKLRPIKGSIVHRQKLVQVPTGYGEDQDVDDSEN